MVHILMNKYLNQKNNLPLRKKGDRIMNKKISSTVVIAMILLSLAVAITPVKAAEIYRVSGKLYIDDVLAPKDVEVTLSFSDGDETAPTSETGHYQIDWDGEDYLHVNERGYFYVYYDGMNFVPEDNTSVRIFQGTYGYDIDLHIDSSDPMNRAPNAPTLESPSSGSKIGKVTSTTLKVKVSDPDLDSMDVSFYLNLELGSLVTKTYTSLGIYLSINL